MQSPSAADDDSDPNALTIAAARARISAALSAVTEIECVALRDARGRIGAEAIDSRMDVPPFRAAAMDGYAVRHSEVEGALTIIGKSLAGHPGDDRLPPASCQSITTGARVPDDADTVVQHENTTREGKQIRISVRPVPGLHVRGIGSDSAAGSRLVEAGARLGASELAVLASHGITKVSVRRRLKIALFSTGDELVDAGMPVARGQIHDANRILLESLLDDPCATVDDLGICADAPAALDAVLERALQADIIVSSGGVSVGEADHVRDAIEAHGDVTLWKIGMKPGRPLTFGRLRDGTFYFGLPGNPVSAGLTALLFVRPAIAELLGHRLDDLPAMTARLTSSLTKRPGRVEYQRGILTRDQKGAAQVSTTGLQDSHMLKSLQRANCLIELSSDSNGAETGTDVHVYPFTHFSVPIL